MGPKINIVSRKLIKPSNPTPKHLQSFKLSIFDQLAPSYHIKIILYYSINGENKASNNSQLLTQLEEPLAHTLSKFYPLAGRFVKDQEHLFIDCSDQGIEYLEAKFDGELAELLHQRLDVENLDQLLPQEVGPADSATTPLLTIQTTSFYCGGLSIGMCVSHKVADTSTVLSFINVWAKANQGENINNVLCPDFGVPSLFPLKNSMVQNIPELAEYMEVKIVTRRFLFDETEISRLKDLFKEKATTDQEIQPTRVTLVTAVIWKALISVAQAKHGQLRPSLLVIVINLRGRTAVVPISKNAFANSWTTINARFTPTGNILEWFHLVPLLSDAVRNTAKFISKAGTDDISLLAVTNFKEEQEGFLENSGVDAFIRTSWSKLPAYDADFGWGRPSWVSSARCCCEMITLLDSKCGDGIEVCVSLNEKDMYELERDIDICTFTSLH
uniref:Acetyl-CoA-benzylalcohol acetyltransferase-like n=1 Tax=Nicotiana tabacum TaxID=4097 RepID=A0A1S3X055_TOBAC|nr:PREDICTED: acetyl-CoA-benzylalcohol acetyltransferase-like [Nicotiana tabacum]